MIGKPEWFTRRKYTGWGINPKTWQGWVYILAMLVPFVIFQALPFWNVLTRIIVTGIWILVLLVDVTHIMVNMKIDEREKAHEAISERNALWAIMLVIVLGILYGAYASAQMKRFEIDPILIIALSAALIVKAISNFYLDRTN